MNDFDYGLREGIRDTTEIPVSIIEHGVNFDGFLRLLLRTLEDGVERLHVWNPGIRNEADPIIFLDHPSISFGANFSAINNTLPSPSFRVFLI